jgi:hypothetical protein
MSGRRLRAAALLAAAALLIPAADLPAYLVRRVGSGGDEVRWLLDTAAPNVVGGAVTYYLDTGEVPDLTAEEYADGVRDALAAWEEVPGTRIRFQEDAGRAAGAKNASDRVNRIGFSGGVLGENTFGSAYTFISGSRILDVDVVLNPAMNWSVQSPGSGSAADLIGVVVHEWGHAIGMDHIPLPGSTMFYAATMGQVSLRSLAPDDAAAVVHLYPAPEEASEFASAEGTVDVAGVADDRGIQVVLVDVVTGKPAASAFTLPDGSWRIEGVPPGGYRVLAAPIGGEVLGLGAYSPYWDGATTGILPAIRGSGGAASVLVLAAGQEATGVDLAVATGADPKEPNGSAGSASPLPADGAAAGRMESSNDHDFYSFAGTAGQAVTILLHAHQIGSDLDARMYLRNAGGTALAADDDLQTSTVMPDGPDLDPRIVDFVLPATGTYFVEVEPSQSPDTSRIEDFFYVLTVQGGGGAASPLASTFEASPPVVPADGVSSSTLVFTPRNAQGALLGAGRTVAFEAIADGNADGVLAVAVDGLDGTYAAKITAPSEAAADVIRALVDGTPVATATVHWLGEADAAASEFAATPRRIRADGGAESEIALVPRDANGLPLGAGRDVTLLRTGGAAATVGATEDAGDGSYGATLVGGTERGAVILDADLGDGPLGAAWEVGIGFPLGEVVDDAAEDLADAVDAGPPAKALPKLVKARDLLAAAAALDPVTGAASVATAAKAALKQMEAAARKGADTAALARELAEAVRETAMDAVAEASPLADLPAEIAAVTKAQALLAAGDGLLDAGLASAAAAKHRAALLKVAKVQ